MIAPHTNPSVIHLVAPPSIRPSDRVQIGRTIPCLLLAGALREQLTPAPPLARIVILGDSSTKESAESLGIPFTDHFAPLLSRHNSIKRTILARLENSAHTPSRVICWSDELIHLASSIATHFDIPSELISTRPQLIAKPPQNIDTIRVFESQDHDTWLDRRRICQSDQLLASVIDPPFIERSVRSEARSRLGIDDTTIVLGAIADAPGDVDAREFAFLLGLLSVSGYKVLGIVPKSAKNLNQAQRHHRGLNQPFRLMTTTDPLPRLLPLLDAAIHPTDERSGSAALIDRYCERADITILHLRHSGKAGFSRAQGTSGRLLDQMDMIVEQMQSQITTPSQPSHAIV